MLAFQRVNDIYNNVDCFKVSRRVLDGFSPILQIKKVSELIFRSLDDELDDSVVELKIAVWRLKTTIELSILPFNSKNLELSRLSEEVRLTGQFYPELKDHIESLREVVQWLTENPENPKHTEVVAQIRSLRSDKKIGIAARLARGRIPGWDDDGWAEFQSLVTACPRIESGLPKYKRIISVATLRKELFDLILVPSGGGKVPFKSELFTAYAAPEVLLICYNSEVKFVHSPKKLAPGSVKIKVGPKPQTHSLPTEMPSESVAIDDWFDKNFWELTRKNILKGQEGSESTESEQFTVKGRLALLGAKKGVYFREDHKIIEISDLIEGRVDIDDIGNKYPRKSVQELKRGNLVVLRTSGSGDALDDVAASLMMSDGKFNLLDTSCEWKALLRQALECQGTDVVAAKLAKSGHQIREPNYLWLWTTQTVIKPESKETFVDLIRTINELGYELPSDSSENYAHEKWEEMRTLIRYRMKAGQKIREALLRTLRDFIKKGIQVEDEHQLSLVGVGGGELTIFRVTGMDHKSQIIPYSKTGVVTVVEA